MSINRNISTAAPFTFIMVLVMRWQGASLKTATTPRGIIDLEFANHAVRLHEVLGVWNLSVAKGNIWLDFLFIVSYVWLFAACAQDAAMKWQPGMLKQFGFLAVRLAFIAGLLDICENLLMLQSIALHYSSVSLQLTYFCASTKFLLVLLLILYLLISAKKIFFSKP